MKQWPKNGKTVDAEKLLDPLAKILRKAYKQKPDINLDFDYKGFRLFGNVIQPDETFNKEFLTRQLEDQGYDLIDSVLNTALQYGIEQGRRIDKKTLDLIILMNKNGLDLANNLLPHDD